MLYFFFYIISFLLFALVNLVLDNGLLGNSLRNKYNFYMKNNEVYVIIVLSLWISFIVHIFLPDTAIFCADEETEKTLAKFEGNNVNIHNPNIQLPNSLCNAVTSLGVGGAVAAGMTTASALMKSGGPLGVKLGVTAIGGAIGGALFVSTNYMNTIAQRKAEFSSVKKPYDPNFSAKSILENFDGDDPLLNAVLGLLNINFILHLCILYLLIALPVLYISSNKYNVDFLKKVLGVTIYNLLVKLLTYTSNTNKIWLIIIWILLIIACLGALYISHYLSLNIDIISEIYQNSKK